MTTLDEGLRAARKRLLATRPFRLAGRVRRVVGLGVESDGPPAAIGEECIVEDSKGKVLSRAEVVGFSGNRLFSMPLERMQGIAPGTRIVASGRRPSIPVGPQLLGRVVDADARPIDRGASLRSASDRMAIDQSPPRALQRGRIREPFCTGVRAIDGALALGRGQRIGIFAGSGVGKSTLLGMIARHARADVAVIALVGERGREVRAFLDNDLGEEGQKRAVVFVATSDEPPMRRIRAAQAATAAAEYFRSQGRDILLMMDSITRVAMAQREIGLSLSEPPSTKGYPPSTFSLLPRLLERAGTLEDGGSITGLYTVYVEGDDLNDPISDAARSLLDGHIVLSRELADRGQYPAVDTLASVSRVMPQVVEEDQLHGALRLRTLLGSLKEAEDLIALGAYQNGSDPRIDAALAARPQIDALLRQRIDEPATLDETRAALTSVVEASRQRGAS